MTDTDDKAVAAYAADVEATRARIAATIDALQVRLQPRALATQAAESLMTSGVKAFAGSGTALLLLGRRLLRDHPIATAGAGLGLGLALLARNRLESAEVDIPGDYEPYSDFEDGYVAKVPRADGAAAAGAVDENPLAAVLAGLAAGALIGALFPESRTEDRLIGSSSDRLAAAAKAATRAARSELLGPGRS